MNNRNATVIELTRDITNPEPDRRSKRMWTKQPGLKALMRFIVRDTADGWKVIDGSEKSYYYVVSHSPLGKLIMENSVEVPPRTVYELAVVTGSDYGSDCILEYLLKLGRIDKADFEAVAAAIEAEDDFDPNATTTGETS